MDKLTKVITAVLNIIVKTSFASGIAGIILVMLEEIVRIELAARLGFIYSASQLG